MKAKSSRELFEIGVGAVFLGTTLFSLILGLLLMGTPVLAQVGPCEPVSISVLPPLGSWVPVGHGINMVFGPADPACTTICWDTLSFNGWLNIMHGGFVDSVHLGPGDVEFWFGDYPEIGIEYHHPGGWPYGATIHGGWAIATCDSLWADRMVYFHTAYDTTPEPDCGILFYEALPEPGAVGVAVSEDVQMWFGPSDPACTSFCIDTSTFEGVVIVNLPHPGGADTVYLSPWNVGWNYSRWPIIEITFDHPWDWPAGSEIHVAFHVSDCYGGRAHGVTHFAVVGDSVPPELDCEPVSISVLPPLGSWVPVGHGINVVFGPADPACTTICWDTLSFYGWLNIMHGGFVDSVHLGPGDVEFWFGDYPEIGIEYHHPGGWPYGATIHGGWAIATCDSLWADRMVYFHTAYDTTPEPDCGILFYEALPEPGAVGVAVSEDVQMWFGPSDPACTSFCIDTSTFEGVVIVNLPHPGGADTVYLSPWNVGWNYSRWPIIEITFDHPWDWPAGSEIHVAFHVSDCYGGRAHGVTHFVVVGDSVPPIDTLEITWITPLEYFSACSLQEVVFVVEPEVPAGLTVFVDWGFYVLGTSPELSVSGDTVTYTPMTHWSDGVHVMEVGDIVGGRLEFVIDKTPPVSNAIYPSDGGSLPIDTSIIRIHLHEPPMASGVDLESSMMQIFIDGVPAGSHSLSAVGIIYDDPVLVIDLEILDPSLVLASGDDVMIIFGIRDNVSVEYCGPNLNVWSLDFTIADTLIDLHLLHGVIVDESTGAPLGGIAVQVFNYLGSPIPGLVDTTGSGGGYEILVHSGVYSLGAFDPAMAYHPVFYHDRYDLLFADPIVVNPTSPSAIMLDTLHMHPVSGGGAMFSVSGIITEAGDGPIDAAYVVAISSEDDEIESAVITNPFGEYVLGLSDGDYIILAFHESYMPGFYGGSFLWASAETIAVAGASITGIDIELQPMFHGGGDFRLFGTVFSDDGGRALTTGPQRGARVYLLDAGSEQVVSATVSDNTGFYGFSNLDAGTYRIIPDLVGYAPTSGWWDVHVSGLTEVDVTLVEYTNVDEKEIRARGFELGGVSPNPFNSACAISYSIDKAGEVAVEVFDINGRLVETLENRSLPAGEYITLWNPDRGDCRKDISSGVYFVRISLDGEGYSRRVLLIK
jgi:hypothetical protein